jgi:hypothetical protein
MRRQGNPQEPHDWSRLLAVSEELLGETRRLVELVAVLAERAREDDDDEDDDEDEGEGEGEDEAEGEGGDDEGEGEGDAEWVAFLADHPEIAEVRTYDGAVIWPPSRKDADEPPPWIEWLTGERVLEVCRHAPSRGRTRTHVRAARLPRDVRTLALAAMVSALAAAAAPAARTSPLALAAHNPTIGPAWTALTNPRTGDAFLVRLAEHQYAQQRSDALYNALAALLGGAPPQLNFVPMDSSYLNGLGDMSANGGGFSAPDAPAGTINIDPVATISLIDDDAVGHDIAVNQLPHEDAHLHQTAAVLADTALREGSAQAFADLVAETAAAKAGIPYRPGSYDGGYSDYVAQAMQRGRDWILAGQFGRAGSPSWP